MLRCSRVARGFKISLHFTASHMRHWNTSALRWGFIFLQKWNGFSFLLAVQGDAQTEHCSGNNTKNEIANEKLEERKTVGVLPAEMECECVCAHMCAWTCVIWIQSWHYCRDLECAFDGIHRLAPSVYPITHTNTSDFFIALHTQAAPQTHTIEFPAHIIYGSVSIN